MVIKVKKKKEFVLGKEQKKHPEYYFKVSE